MSKTLTDTLETLRHTLVNQTDDIMLFESAATKYDAYYILSLQNAFSN